MTTKTCNRCRKALPADAFARRARSADGLQHTCRSCKKTDDARGVRLPMPPAPAPPPGPWRPHAACRGTDLEAWYRLGRAGVPARHLQELCVTCPVRRPCLAEELAATADRPSQQVGYRAGTSPAERVAIHRARNNIRRTA